ncbi:MAG: Crp/Fnr family transcriptional regulator [Chitinophagales bacterium]|nr:Crp/Fnr family transcriptional regulator [Bacteroidota bacterium]MBX7141006.1 Crp/Fnr family transcriptional regulator [Chitinophagales bacterium]
MKESKLLLIEKVMLLKSLSIFADTPETILAEIAHLIEEIELPARTSIFNEGDLGNCMYIIFSGAVRIHRGDQTLAEFHEKDFFGELSLLDTESRSASATTMADSFLLKIDQGPFYDLMESRPEVVKGVMRILCQRIRNMNQRLMEISHS